MPEPVYGKYKDAAERQAAETAWMGKAGETISGLFSGLGNLFKQGDGGGVKGYETDYNALLREALKEPRVWAIDGPWRKAWTMMAEQGLNAEQTAAYIKKYYDIDLSPRELTDILRAGDRAKDLKIWAPQETDKARTTADGKPVGPVASAVPGSAAPTKPSAGPVAAATSGAPVGARPTTDRPPMMSDPLAPAGKEASRVAGYMAGTVGDPVPAVRDLQIALGFTGTDVDGRWGNDTTAALADALGVSVDAIRSTKTSPVDIDLLISALAARKR